MGHFQKLMCEEIIFPLYYNYISKERNYGLRYEVIIFPEGSLFLSLYPSLTLSPKVPLLMHLVQIYERFGSCFIANS